MTNKLGKEAECQLLWQGPKVPPGPRPRRGRWSQIQERFRGEGDSWHLAKTPVLEKNKAHKYTIIINKQQKKNVSKLDTQLSPFMLFFVGSPAMLTRVVHNCVMEMSESGKPRTKSFICCDDWQLNRIRKQTSWWQGGGSSVLFLDGKKASGQRSSKHPKMLAWIQINGSTLTRLPLSTPRIIVSSRNTDA